MFSIATYFSVEALLLLLVTVALYVCLPQRVRRYVLLISSYVFFFSISGKLLVFLLFSTLSVHHIGLWLSDVQNECNIRTKGLEREERKALNAEYNKKQRKIMAFACILHIGALLVLKYTPFFGENINALLELVGLSFRVKIPRFLIPIGISFYTLQAVAYLFDVYRKKIPADRNLLRLALFMSFFPQIMEGPICRYSDTAESLYEAPRMHYNNFVLGSQRILFGLMKKLVIADRLNLLIQNVYAEPDKYDGFVIALGAVGYTFQLYADFSGTMDLVIGAAQMFGIKLPENFKRPFFSATISEFWKRWHITLGTWFKDYIFFPVSMSKPMKKLTTKARKKLGNHYGPLIAGAVSLFCVWICNGLWHGAGWNYIFFGMYHFALILSGNIIEPAVVKITQKLKINRSAFPYRCVQIVRTFILVCFGELFFRQESLAQGFKMFGKIFTEFTFKTLKDGSLFELGMDRQDYLIIIVCAVLLFIIGILQEKGIEIRASIAKRNTAVQFAVYYALILFIVIFGAYGVGYVPLDPIYAGF